jgi:GNAT superfamily N-acetyltransferase
VELRRIRLSDPEGAPLLAGLTIEYDTRYGANAEMSRAGVEEFDPPAGAFVVLMDGGTTAAGGGFRRHDTGVCEVKRMWTDPRHRRQGLAHRILDALEEDAVAAGYERLILETGPRQPEAVSLYEARGYARTPAYGHYADAVAFAVDLGRAARPGRAAMPR